MQTFLIRSCISHSNSSTVLPKNLGGQCFRPSPFRKKWKGWESNPRPVTNNVVLMNISLITSGLEISERSNRAK